MLLAAIRNALQRLPPCCSPAQSYLLTFETWIQMPLPLNIAIAIYPGKWVPTVGCAKTQESICLKSSSGQLLMWISGLLFSEEKISDYSLSSCMQHAQGWNSFQARRRQRGIVQLKWKCFADTGNPGFSSKTSGLLLVPAFIPSMFSICRQQGKIRRSMKYLPNIETFAESLFSTPGLVQRTPLVYPILLKCKYSQIHWHNYQAFFFPNPNISIKHRQIGGQSVRFALHKRFSITVGCRFAWRRIRWFQHSRDSLKGSGSNDVC